MKYGVCLPNFGCFGDPQVVIDLAQSAESAGWDGFFLWDHVLHSFQWYHVAEPWTTLAAVAVQTKRVRLGAMITPLSRRRPWNVVRETVTLDHLSGGRVIFGVGLGAPVEEEFRYFGEETNAKIRAKRLDEGLDIVNGLWSGEAFSYQGEQYQLEEMAFLPRPVQRPRIPVWVGGMWPNKAPFRRAARWDGVYPISETGVSPEQWYDIMAYVKQHRTADTPFDAAHAGATPGDNPAGAKDTVAPYTKAGVTWWMEDISPLRLGWQWKRPWPVDTFERLQERVQQGPPKL